MPRPSVEEAYSIVINSLFDPNNQYVVKKYTEKHRISPGEFDSILLRPQVMDAFARQYNDEVGPRWSNRSDATAIKEAAMHSVSRVYGDCEHFLDKGLPPDSTYGLRKEELSRVRIVTDALLNIWRKILPDPDMEAKLKQRAH